MKHYIFILVFGQMYMEIMDQLDSKQPERQSSTKTVKHPSKFTSRRLSSLKRVKKLVPTTAKKRRDSEVQCQDQGTCLEVDEYQEGSEKISLCEDRTLRDPGAMAPGNTTQYLMSLAYEDRVAMDYLDYQNRDFEELWALVTRKIRDSVEL